MVKFQEIIIKIIRIRAIQTIETSNEKFASTSPEILYRILCDSFTRKAMYIKIHLRNSCYDSFQCRLENQYFKTPFRKNGFNIRLRKKVILIRVAFDAAKCLLAYFAYLA